MAIDEKAVTEQTPVEVFARTVFELVQEEELEGAPLPRLCRWVWIDQRTECKAKFDKIKSVFIYSLQPKRLIVPSLALYYATSLMDPHRTSHSFAPRMRLFTPMTDAR